VESYLAVESQQDLDQLLASTTGFHDSLTKEIHLVNRNYVHDDKSIVYANFEAGFDAQVLIQSQWAPFAIELLFTGVRELYVGDSNEHWGATGSLEVTNAPVESRLIRISFDDDLKVCSDRLFYRFRSEWLGTKSHLKSEVPSPDAISATQLDGKWRQCSSCCDAWEEEMDEEFAYCPSCGHLTELRVHDS
jgi:hypothetical protein